MSKKIYIWVLLFWIIWLTWCNKQNQNQMFLNNKKTSISQEIQKIQTNQNKNMKNNYKKVDMKELERTLDNIIK